MNPRLGRKLGNFFIMGHFLQEGRTPLHYSAALHDSGIFYRYLLKCGADENIQDKVRILVHLQRDQKLLADRFL